MTKSRREIIKSGIICAFLMLTSCGGGTTGTDTGTGTVRMAHIIGNINSLDGGPVQGVQVTVIETGDFALSNESGVFELDSMPASSSVQLQISKNNLDAKTIIDEIPLGDSVVALNLIADEANNLVSVTSIEITPLEETNLTNSGQNMAKGIPLDDNPADASPNYDDSPREGTNTSYSIEKPQKKSFFMGVVSYKNGAPVSSAKIILQDTKDWDITTNNGQFMIQTPVVGGNLTLRVEFAGLTDTVTLPNIPKKPVKVEVLLRINIEHPASANPRPEENSVQRLYSTTPILKTQILALKVKS